MVAALCVEAERHSAVCSAEAFSRPQRCLSRRGFVRERPKPSRQLRDSRSSAADGRPLGAVVHVMGINHSISASAVFGDFYRYAKVFESLRELSCLAVYITPLAKGDEAADLGVGECSR